jgi:hypothetical protein
MRFASVTYEGRNMAVVLSDDEALPLEGVSELGAGIT